MPACWIASLSYRESLRAAYSKPCTWEYSKPCTHRLLILPGTNTESSGF